MLTSTLCFSINCNLKIYVHLLSNSLPSFKPHMRFLRTTSYKKQIDCLLIVIAFRVKKIVKC